MTNRILSINGNKPMNYLIRQVLSKKWGVLAVANVTEGIQHLKKQKDVDLLVVDIDSNQSENMAFIDYIKGSSLYNKKVIVMGSSGYSRHGDNLYFVPKPFNPTFLVETAGKMLDPINANTFIKSNNE